jgi:hypothetical protein
LLLLGYLQYLLSLNSSHLARAALNNSIELADVAQKSWARQVLNAAEKLPCSIPPLDFINATPVASNPIENWWKKLPRTGYSKKSTNQTKSICCTEDENLKRTNLPSKNPFT